MGANNTVIALLSGNGVESMPSPVYSKLSALLSYNPNMWWRPALSHVSTIDEIPLMPGLLTPYTFT